MNWQDSCQVRWRARAHFVIFDAAYGDGAAFQKTLHAWRNDPQRPARLHYIALAGEALPGYRRVPQIEDAVTLDLLSAPLDNALEQLTARLDAIWLHQAFDAGTRFAHALGKLAAPGALLDADGLTQAQMAAIERAGFVWETSAGAQRAVYASRRPQAQAAAPRARHAIVIGAGLAGAAACERLCARGWKVTLIERHAQPAQEASGNRAGITMPLLSKDDNLMTRLSRAAFVYAQAYFERIGENAIDGARCGVLQVARDAAHAEVQRAIAAGRAYPPDFAEWLEAPAATELLGAPAPDGAWLFRRGGWIRPASACGAMLTACGEALTRHFGAGSVTLERRGEDWCAIDAAGEVLARAPVLVLANGTGATSLALAAGLPLSAVRGQVTHLAEGAVPANVAALPFVLCREAYLTPAVGGLHSLGASYDDDADPALRQSSQDENLARIRAMLGDPALGRGAPLLGRVGFRCVAPDRMPLVGALPDPDAAGRIERLRDVPRHSGVYGLLGYASRGLTWAPLAAELLAAQLNGEPLPLEADLVAALDPARFLLRDRRRGEVG